ncbi:MAG: tetratricopeptide repeat protein [Gammaproteobacteria bacterium]
MRVQISLTCLIASFLIVSSSWAGLDEGIKALDNGNTLTATNEFTSLAEQGSADGQYYLGRLYQLDSTATSRRLAVIWLKKAAEQGHTEAQGFLASQYASGFGVDKDLVLAYKWYSLAAQNSKIDAMMRDSLKAEMSSAQLARANNMVIDWQEAHADQPIYHEVDNLEKYLVLSE